jgi:hypothetical protein
MASIPAFVNSGLGDGMLESFSALLGQVEKQVKYAGHPLNLRLLY